MVSTQFTRDNLADKLRAHGINPTHQRIEIAFALFSRHEHLSADQVMAIVNERHCETSKATVYNTLDLLIACDLIKKHQFGNQQTQYEKAYHYRQHDHLICDDCNQVLEFCDPRIQQIQNKIGELLRFRISNHSLILHGHCERENCPNLAQAKK